MEQAKVQEFLISLQAQGRIQLRFSEAHVTEATPTTQNAIPIAAKRLDVIKQLCGKHCLIHPIDLLEQELDAAKGCNSAPCMDVHRSDGFWFPRQFQASELLLPLENVLAEELAALGRQERRRLLKDGKLTPAGYNLFREAHPHLGREIAEKCPLSPQVTRAIEQYYSGKIDREHAVRLVQGSMADLGNFAEWCTKDWETATAFSQNLRTLGKEFQDCLNESGQQVVTLNEASMPEGYGHESLNRIMIEVFYEELGKGSSRLVNSLARSLSREAIEVTDPWMSLPGLACATTLAMHIARRSVTLKQARIAKQSDFVDTYHAIYLPYVDVFRADAFVAGLIRECKFPLKTVVVDRFLDLPMKIESALAHATATYSGSRSESEMR